MQDSNGVELCENREAGFMKLASVFLTSFCAVIGGIAEVLTTTDGTGVAPRLSMSTFFPAGGLVPNSSRVHVHDYMNWAVYRAFTRGEMRYYRVVEEKVSLLVDLYDTAQYPHNWYTRKNPFDIKKITPL